MKFRYKTAIHCRCWYCHQIFLQLSIVYYSCFSLGDTCPRESTDLTRQCPTVLGVSPVALQPLVPIFKNSLTTTSDT